MIPPKCKVCGKTIEDKNLAYVIKNGRKNEYYCNKEEYDAFIAEKQAEADFYEDVNFLFDLNMTIYFNSSWSLIKNNIQAFRKTHTREEILWFLNNTLEEAAKVTERKAIDSESNRVKYLFAILRNHIDEYLRNHPVPAPADSKTEVDYYMAPVTRYKPSNQRRAMSLIELEGDDSDE